MTDSNMNNVSSVIVPKLAIELLFFALSSFVSPLAIENLGDIRQCLDSRMLLSHETVIDGKLSVIRLITLEPLVEFKMQTKQTTLNQKVNAKSREDKS